MLPNEGTTRYNGTVVKLDYGDRDAVVRFQDHPYADPKEPKIKRISFDAFYERWDSNKETFVLTEI